jgi:hypothetical protein
MKLIDKIMATVYENGGRWSLASIIAEENPMLFSVPERRLFKSRALTTSQISKSWKPEDLQYLLHNYGSIATSKIAIKLGRTKYGVQYQYRKFKNEKENSY